MFDADVHKDYAEMVQETAIYPASGSGSMPALTYAVLGLTGEAGEVAEKVKKIYRGDRTLDESRDDLLAELGDVLWYVYRVAAELEVSIEDVMTLNALKLRSRKRRGMLQGSGDSR